MKTITISLPLSLDYHNGSAELQKMGYTLSFELQNGTHIVETPPIVVGTLAYLNNINLMAQLSFTYTYEEKNKVITIGGPDYTAEDGVCLTTFPEGTAEYAYQRGSEIKISTDKALYNPNWNYNTPMTPQLDQLFANTVKDASQALIDAFVKEDLTVQVKTQPPALTSGEHEDLKVVYQNGLFAGFYNPQEHYGDEFVVKSIYSVWGGEVTFSKNENFANVIGSTNDPKIAGKSWLQLWSDQYGYPSCCTSLNYSPVICTSSLVGGHVILGKKAQKVATGSNSVYIMPICKAHNNNDNVYMAAIIYQKGVWLKNYMN
ncbi:hypothetical protein C1631_015425 [Chryseobacterium phosphatilyticum]|uniref:Uncharacterized protein n=1 Tax=Chryseobacterium phosphatilyticum TaxID=475075 RepID=A0A316X866_9FLAO|nr:hypothetical protein [Chryseobacterium phosphatilyticum]PWN69439.1 hypothetical protein C1631_015425 [Chryseobacterium phosphatilyticum]